VTALGPLRRLVFAMAGTLSAGLLFPPASPTTQAVRYAARNARQIW
jgi:hypothetical protein